MSHGLLLPVFSPADLRPKEKRGIMEKRTQQKGERGFLLVLGLFSLICLIASLKMFLTAPKLSGEGTVPALCALVMLVSTVVILLELRGMPRPFEDGIPLVRKAKETFAYLFPGKVGIIILYCALYAVMLNFIGFAVSTFLFLVFSMMTLNHQNKLRTLVISAITVLCILVVFQYIFQVQLP